MLQRQAVKLMEQRKSLILELYQFYLKFEMPVKIQVTQMTNCNALKHKAKETFLGPWHGFCDALVPIWRFEEESAYHKIKKFLHFISLEGSVAHLTAVFLFCHSLPGFGIDPQSIHSL